MTSCDGLYNQSVVKGLFSGDRHRVVRCQKVNMADWKWILSRAISSYRFRLTS